MTFFVQDFQAQSNRLKFEHLLIEDSLFSNEVYRILQDNKGKIKVKSEPGRFYRVYYYSSEGSKNLMNLDELMLEADCSLPLIQKG